MYINQYYNQWLTQYIPPRFYCYNDYTWNSPSVDMGGNYTPIFTQLNVFEIPQNTQITIEITNNSEFDPYDVSNLQIDFGNQFFYLNQIMGPNDPYMLGPGEHWDYYCIIPQSVMNPQSFILIPSYSTPDVDVTIRVVFPEIFTGWMLTQAGMRQYDSSLNEWTSY